jgi:hypothetical protein
MTPDPRVIEWILASPEPAARWIVHAHLLDGPDQVGLAAAEHDAVLNNCLSLHRRLHPHRLQHVEIPFTRSNR